MRTIIIFFIAAIICSCHQRQMNADADNRFSKLDWLKGYWEFEIDNGLFAESWVELNDSVLLGYGIMMIGNDTVSRETMSLEFFDGEMYYVVVAEGQNEGKAVRFKLVSDTGNTFVFENKDHDFPKKITYRYIDDNSFQALVEGDKDNNDGFELFMTKVRK